MSYPRIRAILFASLSFGFSGLVAQTLQPIHWAAVGASITARVGYPEKLQTLLGPAFLVQNEGVSGTTLLKNGDLPYWTKGKLGATFSFKPSVVTVMLGSNDSKPVNWPAHKGEFLGDMEAMVDTLAGISSLPKIFLCLPPPVFQKNGVWAVSGINEPVLKNEILPLIRQAAVVKQVGIVDAHTPLESHPELFLADGVHPDSGKAGADSLAQYIFRVFKANATRIACIGNSITDNNHDSNAYPIGFNRLLGRDYFVLNAGHSGRTLLRKGDYPYKDSPRLREVFDFHPDIITIKLGTNDSKPQNWDLHSGEFISDLNWMIDTLSTIVPKPRIILLTPVPAWRMPNGTESYLIRGDIIKNEIIPKIKQVAAARNLSVVDLHTPFLPYQRFFADGVHPNAEGLDTLAQFLFRSFKTLPVALRQQAYSGQKPAGSLISLPSGIVNPLAPWGLDAAGRKVAEEP